jgi:thiol-disulfide isomerase/thioredoxin
MQRSGGCPQRFFLVAIALGLGAGVACKSSAEPAEPGQQAGEAPSARRGESGAASTAAAPGDSKVHIVASPEAGAVDAAVRAALTAAAAERRTLVVYVGATWCEPCQRFHQAAAHGDLDAAFPRLTLLEFDLDRDRERLASAGYVSKYIPLFALPAPDGSASGKQIEGAIKGDGAVGVIVPRLKEMLSE